ncbi:MAG: amidohydrolase [Chloroflexi bacterium]|nr:amidohydrolase [Chloroflexota bacterium]
MQPAQLMARAQALAPELLRWRRDLHQRAELGFQEHETAAYLASTLEAVGVRVRTGVAKTGLVGALGTGRPAIGLRGDMDALPIVEANDMPHTSRREGVMHACGHDGNMTVVLGAARLLAELTDRPAAEFRFLLQPSEENQDADGKSGAMRMLEEGALEGLDYVIGQHVHSDVPVGQIRISPGYIMASADAFEATITGRGAHGAYPHQSIDPIFLLGQVIPAVQGIVARRVKPQEPAVVTIGAVHSGLAGNVIPERVTLAGTLRAYSPAVRDLLWSELDRALSVARALGGDYTLRIDGGYPATHNNAVVAETIVQVARELAGEGAVGSMEPSMGAEDFSLMAAAVPGAMFQTGVALPGPLRPHHSETFDLDEQGLVLGVAVMAATALRLAERAQ